MKIFYKEKDGSFCGSMNIDKQKADEDVILSIEVLDNEWMTFIQTAQEIYIKDGKLVSKEREISLQEQNLQELNRCKQELQASDFKAIKFSEGLYTAEEYESIKQERQALRNRINELQEALNV